ncbi:MAG: UDP-2,3-diacylglucosamine diphosphatase [Edaphobacter sp.]
MNDSCQTLILSDLHLGSELSRAGDALQLLRHQQYEQLILLGDIFAHLNFRRLTGEQWELLSLVRKLSNPKRRVKVIWVEGNHDQGLSEVMSHLVGIPVYQRYVWKSNGKRNLAMHGHQFDRFVSKNYFLSRVGEQIFHRLQRIEGKSRHLAQHLDRMNTRWLRLTDKVADGALAYARAGQIDQIFCGHTHVAAKRHADGVSYYNSGCWVDAQPTYITIGEEGVQIHVYDAVEEERVEYCHSRAQRGGNAAAAVELLDEAELSAFGEYQSVRC